MMRIQGWFNELTKTHGHLICNTIRNWNLSIKNGGLTSILWYMTATWEGIREIYLFLYPMFASCTLSGSKPEGGFNDSTRTDDYLRHFKTIRTWDVDLTPKIWEKSYEFLFRVSWFNMSKAQFSPRWPPSKFTSIRQVRKVTPGIVKKAQEILTKHPQAGWHRHLYLVIVNGYQ